MNTAPTCSSVECENFAAANACVITQAEATTLSSGDAFSGALFHRAMKCSQFEAQSTCTADSECAWEYDTDEKAYTCDPSNLGTLALAECPALTPHIQTVINANPRAAGLGVGAQDLTPKPTVSGSTSCRLTQTFTLTALVVGALALVAQLMNNNHQVLFCTTCSVFVLMCNVPSSTNAPRDRCSTL